MQYFDMYKLSLNLIYKIDRWLGEPVRCLILPTTLFLTNKKGYPVLSKAHQALVKRFSVLEIQFILTGASRYQSVSYYHNYLDYLWKVRLKRLHKIIER